MKPSTDWKEIISADEDARFTRHAEHLRDLQHARKHGDKADRGLHAKGVGFTAELTVASDLPEHARIGPFAIPNKTYRAYVRYSNGSGSRGSDKKSDVRGIAIKLLGVEGKKIIPGMEDATTQDLLAIATPFTPFRNADEFVTVVRAAESPALLPIKVAWALGLGRMIQLVKGLTKKPALPFTSFATHRFFSALPIQFGPYAVHYCLDPKQTANADDKVPEGADGFVDDLVTRLKSGPISYDLRVQYFVDEARTPIEDASVEWKESDSPFVTIATLVLAQQDATSTAGMKVRERVEAMSFDPWHAVTELKPLGNMMRARNHAYRLSTIERGASKEPDGSEF
jgi:catalase